VVKRAGSAATAELAAAAAEFSETALQTMALVFRRDQTTLMAAARMPMVVWEAHPLCADRAVTVDSELPVVAWVDMAAVAAVDTPVALVVSIDTGQMFALAAAVAVHTQQVL
jgi:hypothetical protein